MHVSAGQRFKPTKYIPVCTAAALLVGSSTLFFVFTVEPPQSSAVLHLNRIKSVISSSLTLRHTNSTDPLLCFAI
ncbi:palmitoyltransferase ZDHHC8B isoform X1 [Tachysurus ichikawai]